ncbi:Uncharacterised protein [Porphyromonas cangingivalis]|uniref:Uncharacterized protein n=1 Tax=Porphyromonas cangingivalis TaxID=36874 RepID=A0A1T4NQL6_PORCN|nr:hypothetical protein SAMN02745205_01959 [Porphyromonas cangingivalis]VEJ03635.1 Uncharacterised protein [Porphyromonas cangingivalis]
MWFVSLFHSSFSYVELTLKKTVSWLIYTFYFNRIIAKKNQHLSLWGSRHK